MHVGHRLIAAAAAGLIIVVAHTAAQEPPQPVQTPAPTPGAPQTPAPPAPGQGRGGRGRGVFPAQQRALADPAIVERGRTVFGIHCASCHGGDARGGQLGGPNLLRSPLVLNDQHGELVLPIVRGTRADKGMPPIQPAVVPDSDVVAIAEFIHAVAATSRGQGAPPPGPPVELNIVVGDAKAGEAYFIAKCSSCHSPFGDLQGIATRIADPKALQNVWVAGGGRGGRGGRGGFGGGGEPAAPSRRTVTVSVTQPPAEKIEGRLLRIDDFIVTLMQADGTVRSFRRDGDRPKVEIDDPLRQHRDLLSVYTDKDMYDVTAYLVTLK
jgi:cytochrome c oxidase cbb3-type subunit 3